MLDKSAYYHGAAIIPILENFRCRSIRKLGSLGYVVNDDTFLFIKYTTKERSPWRFTFDQEDVDRSVNMAAEYRRLILAFVCGSDGVCAIDWPQGRDLLGTHPVGSQRGASGELRSVDRAVFAGDSKWIVTSSEDGTLRSWRTPSLG